MKAITSKEEFLKKLKKHNVLTAGKSFYLSDFHKTTVSGTLVNKLLKERIIEPTTQTKQWFENEWKFRNPVGEHHGVNIFYDNQRNQYFFKVKKGGYELDNYSDCLKKLDYLKGNGEKLI